MSLHSNSRSAGSRTSEGEKKINGVPLKGSLIDGEVATSHCHGRGPRGPFRLIRHYLPRVPRKKERFKISTDAKFGHDLLKTNEDIAPH